MAVQFFNGNSHKNNAPIPPQLMNKAAEAAKTYDWTSDPKEVAKIEGVEESNLVPGSEEEYPKKFACRKTGVVATKMEKSSPVLFVKGDLLLLTADEQTVRDIIT